MKSSTIGFKEAALGPASVRISLLLVCLMLAAPAAAQTTTKVELDSSSSLFATMAALNACGYDAELSQSDPLRLRIREELSAAFAASAEAAAARTNICRFIRDKRLPDASQNVAQYVSLAVNLGPAPELALQIPEAELPPDAAGVLGFVPLLRRLHATAKLDALWAKHKPAYDALVGRYSQPVAQMLMRTDLYLKNPIGGYVGRRMVVYLEPLGAPGQVNARNYGNDYYVVISPSPSGIRMEQLRHAYLHYVLDPMALRRPAAMKRMEPILETVQAAPIDTSFKQDISLLVTESVIRAMEARFAATGKEEAAEATRANMAQASTREGFVLTGYFYDALRDFEKTDTAFNNAFGDMLHRLNTPAEIRRASEVVFAKQSAPELVTGGSRPVQPPLDQAEERLSANAPAEAAKLAQGVLDTPDGDHPRALFVLGKASSLMGDIKAARLYFERSISTAKNPRVLAWSHILLARILDMSAQYEDGTLDEETRTAALQHYRAALAAGDDTPETKAAAERGLQQPYAPARRSR